MPSPVGGTSSGKPEREAAGSRIDAAVLNALALLDRYAGLIYALLILAFLVLFGTAAAFLTIEADEAWILLSTMNVFSIPVPDSSALANPTVTNGGVHTVLHGLLALFTTDIRAHRGVSVMFAVLLLLQVYLILKARPVSTVNALAGAALFAAVPGFFLQAGLAMADIIATSVLLRACQLWVRSGRHLGGAVATGVLLGLACATRVNCIVAMPVILLSACFIDGQKARNILLAALCVAIGVVVMATAMGLYVVAANISNVAGFQAYFARSTGLGGDKNIGHVVKYLIIGNAIFPAVLIAAIAAGYAVTIKSVWRSQAGQICAIALLIGLAGWLAWTWKAPIPHVRYLWPSIPFIWLSGILLVVSFADEFRERLPRLAFLAATIAVCFQQGIASALLIASGESLTSVYQLNMSTPLVVEGAKFQAAEDQRQLSSFVAKLPADAKIASTMPEASYPTTYLSHRTIGHIQDMPGFEKPSCYLVAVPADQSIWRPSDAFLAWRNLHADKVFARGGFEAYRIKPDAPRPPHVFDRQSR